MTRNCSSLYSCNAINSGSPSLAHLRTYSKATKATSYTGNAQARMHVLVKACYGGRVRAIASSSCLCADMVLLLDGTSEREAVQAVSCDSSKGPQYMPEHRRALVYRVLAVSATESLSGSEGGLSVKSFADEAVEQLTSARDRVPRTISAASSEKARSVRDVLHGRLLKHLVVAGSSNRFQADEGLHTAEHFPGFASATQPCTPLREAH